MRKRRICALVACALTLLLTLTALVACMGPLEDVVRFESKNLAKQAEFLDGAGGNGAKNLSGRGGVWKKKGSRSASFEIAFAQETAINTLVFKEKTDAVELFQVYARDVENDSWVKIYEQDRIDAYAICYLEEGTKTDRLRVEILQSTGTVKLKQVEIYQEPKAERPNFKVSQYLTMSDDPENTHDYIPAREEDAGFTGYYDVVTDVILIGMIRLAAGGNVSFYEGGAAGKAAFETNLSALKRIIGGRSVRIWACVFFDQYNADGVKDLQLTADFLRGKRDEINRNLKAFVEEYGIDGIDYDWEYPTRSNQWKAYDQIITDTAEYTAVSVAIAPWGCGISKKTYDVIEHFNLMAYDLFDVRMHHSTAYGAGIQAIRQTAGKLGIDREKILLGIPTYGRAVNGSGDSWPALSEQAVYDQIGKWGNLITGYAYWEDGLLKSSDAYLNGYAIARDKTLMAIGSGIGGVMIFRAKCDAPYTAQYSVHRAIEEVIADRIQSAK